MPNTKDRLLEGPVFQAVKKMIASLPKSDAKTVWQSDIEMSNVQLKVTYKEAILSFDVLTLSKIGNPLRICLFLNDNSKNNFLDDPTTFRRILSRYEDPYHRELYILCRGGYPFDPQFLPKRPTFWSATNPYPVGKCNPYNLAVSSFSDHWGYFNENHYVQREGKIIPAYVIPGLGVAILFKEKITNENFKHHLNILSDIIALCARCDDDTGTFSLLSHGDFTLVQDYLDFFGNNSQGFSRIKVTKEFYFWLFEFLYTQISKYSDKCPPRARYIEGFESSLNTAESKIVKEAIETIKASFSNV